MLDKTQLDLIVYFFKIVTSVVNGNEKERHWFMN
jgi:hypothetical protein